MSSNWKEELKEAKQMLDSGLITEEHFHELREEIFQQRRKIQTPPTHSGKRNSNGESSFSSQNTTRNITNTFGSYNIFEKLGEGGMGVVYRSRHKLEAKSKVQGGDVALKLIHLDGSINQDMVERFSSEASTGMELDHPNIIKVLDFVTENTQIGIVMEIIEGESLQNIMDNRSTVFKWKEIQDWIGCICDAMSYAHSQGIVHRDIKPDNIVLDDNGKLTILDFGIAKRQNDSKKTQVGIGLGTPTYMAPEQYFNATKVDGRSDIYALAIMIVEMLTNRLPWNDQLSDDRIYQLKLNDELELNDVLKEFPEHFQVGIKKALQANPQRRQVTMYDFFEDLYPNQKKVLRKTNRTIVFEHPPFLHSAGSPNINRRSNSKESSKNTQVLIQANAVKKVSKTSTKILTKTPKISSSLTSSTRLTENDKKCISIVILTILVMFISIPTNLISLPIGHWGVVSPVIFFPIFIICLFPSYIKGISNTKVPMDIKIRVSFFGTWINWFVWWLLTILIEKLYKDESKILTEADFSYIEIEEIISLKTGVFSILLFLVLQICLTFLVYRRLRGIHAR